MATDDTHDFSTLTNVSPVLTAERLSKALSQWFGESINFTHWEFVSETGKGDSYLSEVIRIRIYGAGAAGAGEREGSTPKHVQVILKNIPKNVCRRLTFRSDEFFRNEINFYNIVLPALLKFQASKTPKEPFNHHVRLFLSYCDGLNDVICLEDASLEDFGSAVRQEGIDSEHWKITFQTLAKFHALSFAMKDQQPEQFQTIRNAIFETYYDDCYYDWYRRWWKRICGIAIDAIEKEFPNTLYLEKIKEFAVPERYKDLVRATKTYESGVISHGDSWTNNFLYKYEKKYPIDAKIIDFQLSRCASPVLDISFAVYACTTQEMRIKHYDEMISYYYQVLSAQIRDLGSDPEKVYPESRMLEELHKYSYFGLAFSFESTPFIVLAPEDAISMDMEGNEKKNIDDFWQLGPFKTKEGRLREANNIVFCVDRGYI